MITRLPTRPTEHVAHVYERDEALVDTLVDFVAEGLRRGEPVILLATADHWNAVERRLREAQVQVGRLLQRREIIVIDAHEALRQMSTGGGFEREHLRTLLASVIDPANGRHRLFGELVSLLAERGGLDAALDVESLADGFVSRGQATILCGYHQHHLGAGAHVVDRVAACHDWLVQS